MNILNIIELIILALVLSPVIYVIYSMVALTIDEIISNTKIEKARRAAYHEHRLYNTILRKGRPITACYMDEYRDVTRAAMKAAGIEL